jgi:hypothetical protein
MVVCMEKGVKRLQIKSKNKKLSVSDNVEMTVFFNDDVRDDDYLLLD